MDNIIGTLDWECCYQCRHYEPAEGGCNFIGAVFVVDSDDNSVRCENFQVPE